LRALRARIQRVVLGLHPPTLADAVEGGEALRHEMGYAGRLGGGQQVVRPFAAQPSGAGEKAVGVLHIGLAGVRRGKSGHLVHDHIRLGRGHASPTEIASSPSITTASAPSCSTMPNLAALVVAVTWWPRATSCGTSRRPNTPVPPATNTRMAMSFPDSEVCL